PVWAPEQCGQLGWPGGVGGVWPPVGWQRFSAGPWGGRPGDVGLPPLPPLSPLQALGAWPEVPVCAASVIGAGFGGPPARGARLEAPRPVGQCVVGWRRERGSAW